MGCISELRPKAAALSSAANLAQTSILASDLRHAYLRNVQLVKVDGSTDEAAATTCGLGIGPGARQCRQRWQHLRCAA